MKSRPCPDKCFQLFGAAHCWDHNQHPLHKPARLFLRQLGDPVSADACTLRPVPAEEEAKHLACSGTYALPMKRRIPVKRRFPTKQRHIPAKQGVLFPFKDPLKQHRPCCSHLPGVRDTDWAAEVQEGRGCTRAGDGCSCLHSSTCQRLPSARLSGFSQVCLPRFLFTEAVLL